MLLFYALSMRMHSDKKLLNQSGESMLEVLHRKVLVEWTRKAGLSDFDFTKSDRPMDRWTDATKHIISHASRLIIIFSPECIGLKVYVYIILDQMRLE